MSPWGPNPEIRRGRTVVCAPHAHLAFTPKYRRKVFDDAMLDRCEEIMGQVCADFGAQLTEFNGRTGHVHLLVYYPPKGALSRLVGSLEGISARRLRQEFTGRTDRAIMHGHLWSPSYFVGSCGGAPLSIVRDYIENQKRPGTGEPRMSKRST